MRTAFALLFLFASLALAQQPDPNVLFRHSVEAQQHGDYQTAIQDYQKLLKSHPEAAEVRANLGAALAHEKRFDEAIVQYHLALKAAPGNEAIRMNLALAYYKKGDLVNARREFEEVRKQEPDNSQLAILLGDSEVRLGQPADAAAMLAPLEAANASNTDFEYVYGTALVRTGKKLDGATRLEKVAEATKSADAYLLAGSTLLDLNEFARAEKDLDAALRLNPNLPRVSILAGMAHDMNGDAAEAKPLLRKGLKRNPSDFDGNLYLGSILYKRRDMAEAKQYLDRAIQLKPRDPTAAYEMAMWDSTSRQFDDAAKILEGLVKSNPDWLQPHVELATVYYRLHRPEDGAKERAIVEKLKTQQQKQGPPKIQQP
ncbi:MAG: tetratricopeptide repeat protein [Acidobacteriaceae bacterium]